jgi:hypothetical protein
MGTSFVSIDGEHGFWMRDGVLEVFLRLLALHVPEPTDSDTPKTHEVARQVRDQWLLASKGFFQGCVPSGLEEAAATEEGRTVIRTATLSLRDALRKAPQSISKDALNLLNFEGAQWDEDFETRRLVETADAFLSLLEGKIAGTARSTDFMPGSR